MKFKLTPEESLKKKECVVCAGTIYDGHPYLSWYTEPEKLAYFHFNCYKEFKKEQES